MRNKHLLYPGLVHQEGLNLYRVGEEVSKGVREFVETGHSEILEQVTLSICLSVYLSLSFSLFIFLYDFLSYSASLPISLFFFLSLSYIFFSFSFFVFDQRRILKPIIINLFQLSAHCIQMYVL